MVTASVIVPVLNSGSHIRNCILSLINQDFPEDEYEIIVVDNGSKDNTLDIINDTICNSNSNVSIGIAKEPKKGSYIARNRGINSSRGKILAFTDADCIADRNWLKELCNEFDSREQNGEKVGCVVGTINPYPGKTLVEIYSKNKGVLSQKTTLESKFLSYGQTANAAFRREVFEKIGIFDEDMMSGGDADIAWRMQMNTDYKLIYCPKAIVEHRHRTTFRGLFKQQFRYGFGRILLYKKHGDYMFGDKKTDTNTNVSHDIKYNAVNSMKLAFTIPLFYIRSCERLFGICDKYYQYEPLLSLLYISGYASGKVYGWIKLRKSFFSTL